MHSLCYLSTNVCKANVLQIDIVYKCATNETYAS